jgi:hypothetical protein
LGLAVGCSSDAGEDTDTAGPTPDVTTPEPDTAPPEPDTATPEPDTATPEPDTATPEPDTAAPEPDTAEPSDPCEDCLASGGTWQPEANACTTNCAIQDISCYTDSCPECSMDSCGSFVTASECEAADCSWGPGGDMPCKCPEECSKAWCGLCLTQSECDAQGCTWFAAAGGMWCTD